MKGTKEKLAEAVVAAIHAGLTWDQIQAVVSNAYDEEYARPRKRATLKRSEER